MHPLLVVILLIVIGESLVTAVLRYLNHSWRDKPIPANLADIYDKDRYATQQEYEKVNYKFSIASQSTNLLVVVVVLVSGFLGLLDSVADNLFSHPIFTALFFFAVLSFGKDIINLPFSIYHTFVIEERFSFNRTTPKTFILDVLKGWVLKILIGGTLLAIVAYLYGVAPNLFWVYAWAVISVVSIFFSMFYTSIIVPIFNKLEPLPAGALREAIEALARKTDFNLAHIYVMDASKRSTKANAFFSGLGFKKSIVLYDTLVKEFTVEETVAVLGHEIGHYKKKHTLQHTVASVLETGISLFLMSLVLGHPAFADALGVNDSSFHIGLLVFTLMYAPITFVLETGMNIWSRHHEHEADIFARQYYAVEPMVAALKKLARQTLSNLTPHPLYVFFTYSHPPMKERLEHISRSH